MKSAKFVKCIIEVALLSLLLTLNKSIPVKQNNKFTDTVSRYLLNSFTLQFYSKKMKKWIQEFTEFLANIYLFKVTKNTRKGCETCSKFIKKHNSDVIYVVLVFLLTLNIFCTLFWGFHC